MRSRGIHSFSHAIALAMFIASVAVIAFIVVGGAGGAGAM